MYKLRFISLFQFCIILCCLQQLQMTTGFLSNFPRGLNFLHTSTKPISSSRTASVFSTTTTLLKSTISPSGGDANYYANGAAGLPYQNLGDLSDDSLRMGLFAEISSLEKKLEQAMNNGKYDDAKVLVQKLSALKQATESSFDPFRPSGAAALQQSSTAASGGNGGNQYVADERGSISFGNMKISRTANPTGSQTGTGAGDNSNNNSQKEKSAPAKKNNFAGNFFSQMPRLVVDMEDFLNLQKRQKEQERIKSERAKRMKEAREKPIYVDLEDDDYTNTGPQPVAASPKHSDLTTTGVRVEIFSFFEAEKSRAVRGKYYFMCNIRVSNYNDEEVKLLGREWQIYKVDSDAPEIMHSEGAYGEKPVIPPGTMFQYHTEVEVSVDTVKPVIGRVEGHFVIERDDPENPGKKIQETVNMAPFFLSIPPDTFVLASR